MEKIYVKIDGITCDHCRMKITKALQQIKNVNTISFDGHIAEVTYKGKLNKKDIVNSIIKIDYYTDLKMISNNKKALKHTMSMGQFLKILIIIILLAIILNMLFGFNIFNMIPVINSKTTYSMLFVTGLLTSVHCISMCGAINLLASSSIKRNFKKPFLYNLGRLVSYTIIGGLVGLIGSVFKFNSYIDGTIIIIASIFMLLMSLNMMGIVDFSLKFKTPKIFNKFKINGPFALGLLNGLMPCGPLQAMQVYALSTGSFIYGALSMFLFCLGTIPLMLLVGIVSNFLNNNHRKIMNKVSTVIVLVLSFVMLNRGLLSMGIDISNIFKPSYDNYLKSEMVEDYQVIEFDLSTSGYKDIVVKQGIPVKMIINVSINSLTGCNNAIKINSFNIDKDLQVGQNVIEFTPNKKGTYTYTCWMGMLKNNIVVIDDKTVFTGGNND